MFWRPLLLSLLASSLPLSAGPVLIGGTDADDHGSATATVNQGGWLYMQKSLEALAAKVSNGQKKVVCLGCNGSVATAAFHSAFDKSSLPGLGWTRTELSTAVDFNAFFANTGIHQTANTGIIYMPSDANNVAQGLTASQLDLLSSNSNLLAGFITRGGGLFTQTQQGYAQGYAWLRTLLPNLKMLDSAILSSSLIGTTAMTNSLNLDAATLIAADQWHNYFDVSQGGLRVLATGKATIDGASKDVPVLLGADNLTSFIEDAPRQAPLPWWLSFSLVLTLLGLAHKKITR